MRKVFIILAIVSFGSCGESSIDHSNHDTISHDSSLPGAIITDSTGAAKINADTSGMSEAR